MKTNGEDEFSFFRLDEHRLDEEWKEQPRLFFRYAKKAAEARSAFEQAKANRDLVAAEIDQDIRKHPEDYEISKITEGAVEKEVLVSPKYQAANNEVLTAKHNMDVIQAAVDALDHRKKALENLVHLFLSNYYSPPKAPKGSSMEDVEEVIAPKEKTKGKTRKEVTGG